MKKLIGLLILLGLLVSSCCSDQPPQRPSNLVAILRESGDTAWYGRTYLIDSCEYIYAKGLTHKGNCKNCRKHYEEIIRTYCDSRLDTSRVR